jgi:hypothetical protein
MSTEMDLWEKILVAVLAVLAFLMVASFVEAAPPDHMSGHIIVKHKLSKAGLESVLKKHGAKHQRRQGALGVDIVTVPEGRERVAADLLGRELGVEWAEVDEFVLPADYTPNDPRLFEQKHHNIMRSRVAWEHTHGEGITIAILDTGVYAGHEDLKNNVVLPGYNVFSPYSKDTSDLQGHGTKVAGTAAAVGDNGLGVAGVAYRARIMPVRIAAPYSPYWSSYIWAAEGIVWAADHGAHVINISYSNMYKSVYMHTAAQYARDRGAIVVVAANNNAINENNAGTPTMIVVSATKTSADALAWFSSYGNMVDVAAPGTAILTTGILGGYSTGGGTSFATPNVSGVIALIRAANPALSITQVENILFQTAKDLGTPGWDIKYGYGRVDAGAAVQAAVNTLVVENTATFAATCQLRSSSGTCLIWSKSFTPEPTPEPEVPVAPIKFSGWEWYGVATLSSLHINVPKNFPELNSFNPGVGVEAKRGNVRLHGGVYRNSLERTTAYALVSYTPLNFGNFHIGAGGGLATGHNASLPVMAGGLVAYERGNWGANMMIIPKTAITPFTLGFQLKVRFK